jgi:serine protease inhibitor
MKRISVCYATVLLLSIASISCKKSGVAPIDQTRTIALPAEGSSVVNASNAFAFHFLQATLIQDSVASNKLISPLSIYLALSMVYNGSNNATTDSMANVLRLSGIGLSSLNGVCQSLITQLPGEDNEVQFSIANSIWSNNKSYQPLPAFIDTTTTFYDAAIEPLDFSNPNSLSTINNWVSQHTNGKIPKALDEISPTDLMYLIDAIYFNGSWTNAFKTSDTKNANFYLADGSTKSAAFMYEKLTTSVYADTSMTIIELPYGGGKSYSMYVMLDRNQQEPVSTFASMMNADLLNNVISKMNAGTVEISIPKWEYSYSLDNMMPELSALGMGIAFGGQADFSKMYDPSQVSPYITKAVHKTYIKVNEQGTEAAAVTSIGIGLTDPANPVITFDHPFLYAIVEKQTGTVLFVGVLNDPSAN